MNRFYFHSYIRFFDKCSEGNVLRANRTPKMARQSRIDHCQLLNENVREKLTSLCHLGRCKFWTAHCTRNCTWDQRKRKKISRCLDRCFFHKTVPNAFKRQVGGVSIALPKEFCKTEKSYNKVASLIHSFDSYESDDRRNRRNFQALFIGNLY